MSSKRRTNTERLIGVHAVRAAIEAGRRIDRVLIAEGSKNRRLEELAEEALAAGAVVDFAPRAELDRQSRGGVHQGVIAFAEPRRLTSLQDIVDQADDHALVVVLDGVEDPHNLGAIIRTADAAGALAVIIPERRAAGVTETVAKAAAGALERLPVTRVANVNRAIEMLQKAGFWAFGLDERGDKTCYEADMTGKVALVLGAEGEGLHRLTAERCDFLIRIPMAGETPSLNVSVAAGVALFEAVRQRQVQADD